MNVCERLWSRRLRLLRSASMSPGSLGLPRRRRGADTAGGGDHRQPDFLHMSGLRPGDEGNAERGDEGAVTIEDRCRESVNAQRIFPLVVRPALAPYGGKLASQSPRIGKRAWGVSPERRPKPPVDILLGQVREENLSGRPGVQGQPLARNDGQCIFAL